MDIQAKEKMLANELGIADRHVCIVGSTLICGQGNDVDFLCLVPSETILEDRGFAPDIEVNYEPPLRSFRRDGLNAIAVTDPRFYFAEVAIAHAARLVAACPWDMAHRDNRIRFHGEVREQVLSRLADAEGMF